MAYDLSEVIDTVCQTMCAAAASLYKPADASGTAPTKPDILAAAKLIRDQVAKVAFMCSQQIRPGPQDMLSLLRQLEQSVCHLCSLLSLSTSGAGQTLQQSIAALGGDVVSAVVRFVKEVILEGCTGKALLSGVGLVFSQCDAIQHIALDNRTAIGRSLTRVAAQVKDVVREISTYLRETPVTSSELPEEDLVPHMARLSTGATPPATTTAPNTLSASENGGPPAPTAASPATGTPHGMAHESQHGADEGGTSDDEGRGRVPCEGGEWDEEEEGMDGAEELSAEDAASVQRGVACVSAVLNVVKTLVRLLLSQTEVSGDAIIEWESICFNCSMLARSSDDFGAALYPPFDGGELEGASAAVLNTCELLVDELPHGCPRDAMEHALEAVRKSRQELLAGVGQ